MIPMPMPPTRPLKQWTFRGLRASNRGGDGADEEEERGALQQGQPAPTGNPFTSTAAVLALGPGGWTAGVWAAVAVVVVVVLGGAGVGIAAGLGAFNPEESSTSTAADALPVTLQPMGYYDTSSSARIRGAGPISVQTCPTRASTITCPADDGTDFDISAGGKYEWVAGYGEGYVDAFKGCSHAASMTTPYANSHCGGLYVDGFALIKSDATGFGSVHNYVAAIDGIDSIAARSLASLAVLAARASSSALLASRARVSAWSAALRSAGSGE